MHTLERKNSGFHQDHSMSADAARVTIDRHNRGPSPERSDPYIEWALRFELGLQRAFERIRDWYRNAASLADEDLEAPSRETIIQAIRVIDQLKHQVMDRVAPEGTKLLEFRGVSLDSGGEISIELGSGPLAVTYRVESDGTATRMTFKNCKLIRTEQISR